MTRPKSKPAGDEQSWENSSSSEIYESTESEWELSSTGEAASSDADSNSSEYDEEPEIVEELPAGTQLRGASKYRRRSGLANIREEAAVERAESDISDNELEELLFGLTNETQKRTRKKKKRRTERYARSLKDRVRPKRKTAATPTNMTAEAQQLMEEANSLFLEEKYDESIEVLKSVTKAAPGIHDPLHLLGLIYETIYEDFVKAINYYFLAAHFVKTDLEAWKHVGQLAQKIKDYDVAIYCYRRVVPRTKLPADTDEEAAYELACLYLKRMDFVRAGCYFTKLFSRHPGDAFLGKELSKCYYQLSQFRSSIETLERCAQAMLSPASQEALFPGTEIIQASEPLDWETLDMLAALYLEQSEYHRCNELLAALLEDHFKSSVLEILADEDSVPLSVAIRLVSSQMRTTLDEQTYFEVGLQRLRQAQHTSERKSLGRYYMALADSFLDTGRPEEALKMYQLVEPDHTVSQKSEFWVRVAKCHMQLEQFDKAAEFLESVVPGGTNAGDESLASRVRIVEARLLLIEVLANLDETGGSSYAREVFGCADSSDAAAAATIDHRIQTLERGTAIFVVPAPISASQRELLLMRLSVGLQHLSRAELELRCIDAVEPWLARYLVDALGKPHVEEPTVAALLPPVLKSLFQAISGNKKSPGPAGGLTKHDILKAVCSRSRPLGQICPLCASEVCQQSLREFLRVWRTTWLAEFVLLIKDTVLDTRRILNESSRIRASTLSRQLAKDKGFLESREREFQPSLNVGDEGDLDSEEDRRIEGKFVFKTRPKTMEMELRRRKQRQAQGFANRLVHHNTHRQFLGLLSIEDSLGWDDFAEMMEAGSRMLVAENLGRLAVELLESILVNARYSRAQGVGDYSHKRSIFRTKIKRLSIRIALASNLMRLALSGVRLKFLLPLIRTMLGKHGKGGDSATPSKRASDVESSITQESFARGLTIYATLLFTEGFAHHAVKSISASRERDIISFNRAWCTRHLMEFPHDFGLTMMVAHYCLLSMRWPYAVAEYTRAVHLRPSNAIASLCLATSTISFSTSRGVQDRHQVVLRGFALLKRFERIRQANKLTLIQSLRSYATEKTHRVVIAVSKSQQSRKDLAHALGADVNNNQDIAQKLAASISETVKQMENAIGLFFEAESVYNLGRACHNLSLDYLALRAYSEVLQILARLEQLIGPYERQLELQANILLAARRFSPPSLATVAHFQASCIRPATASYIEWPSGGEPSSNGVDLGLSVLLAKTTRNLRSLNLEFQSPIQQDGSVAVEKWILPKIEAKPLRCEFALTKPKDPQHPLQGLFAPLTDDRDVPQAQMENEASAVVQEYCGDIVPGLFLLALDSKQLRLSSALNASNIIRSRGTCDAARTVQRTNIVWRDEVASY